MRWRAGWLSPEFESETKEHANGDAWYAEMRREKAARLPQHVECCLFERLGYNCTAILERETVRVDMKNKLKTIFVVMAFVFATFAAHVAVAQDGAITPGENLVVDGVPAIPASLAETAGRYGSFRTATLADWSPVGREMLIATRFGDVPQLHLVKTPGGARQQLTFFADAVRTGRFHPNGGDYIVFHEGHRRWRVVSVVSLRREDGRRDVVNRWESEEFAGAMVVGWRPDRVHVNAEDGERHGFVGDESGGPEERSFVDSACRRWVGAAGLVTRRQEDFAGGGAVDQ